mmetsp:Transcript_63046/g.117977  ORF Transcript_63046/g.117977 Transcript_63046/m.117977 type:complete len:256 (-) Transcript_63046:118-885(-)
MAASSKKKPGKGGDEAPSSRPAVKKDFRHAPKFPSIARPVPEVDSDVMHHAEDVDSDSDLDPAYLSPQIRNKLGVAMEVKLPPALHEAAEESGYRRGVRKIQSAVVGMQASKRDDRMKEKPPPIGSVQLDEQILRKIFQKMDLDGCEAISSKVLRHLMLQMGKEIEHNELEAMIALVDMKETGTATYEDFAAVFGNPAETLRQINVENVKAASRGEVREKKLLDLQGFDEESEEEEQNEEGQDEEVEDDDAIENG